MSSSLVVNPLKPDFTVVFIQYKLQFTVTILEDDLKWVANWKK